MNDKRRSNEGRTKGGDRAIVMGGSMAGLAAARVLSDHYREVVLVERDRFGGVGEHRRGVPQGRHTHGLLASGLRTLEGFFPGLFQEALNAGGLRIDVMRDSHWWFEGGEHARFESGLDALSITRPLLEGIIRERVRRIPNVHFSDDCQVHGLIGTPDNRRVTGIRTSSGTLLADLVVDATGRGSLSPIWLEEMGYDPPKRERIEINVAYTTRRFRRSPHDLNGAFFASIAATPQSRKGGVIAAQEGNSWIVTLYAYCGASAPTELPGFVEFARTLPASYIYDVVSQAEPIGEAQSTRFPASVRRRYERLSRFPEGYLVLGDAVSSFNPVYGQGMSVAALEALDLDKTLQGGSTSLARSFFAQIARIVDVPWGIAAGNDLRMPGVTGSRTPITGFLNWYVAKVHLAAQHDSSVALAFHKVASLLVPPQGLFKPSVIARVLSAAFSYRPVRPAQTAPTAQLA